MSASAKSLRVERITAAAAKDYLDRHHHLGAGGVFSVALGVIWNGRLAGVMTLGAPTVLSAGFAWGLKQHELAELRKMHLLDVLPPNSESRALGVAARLVRKHWPAVKAIITYCDDAEAATAYKACGWIAGKSHRYISHYKFGGRWLTTREANRQGLRKRGAETRFAHRRKWILPLTEELRLQTAQAAPSPRTARSA